MSEIEVKETDFNQDLNSDGIIGIAKTYTEIESLGTISLFKDQNQYSYIQEYGTNKKINIKTKSGEYIKEVEMNNDSLRTIIGAETITGVNTILFKESSGYYTANFDENWQEKHDSYQKIETSLITRKETEFEQDLNNDGSIGNLSFSIIESKGDITLSRDSSNYSYTKASNSDTYIAIKNEDGEQWGDKTWSNWKIVGAESINGLNKTVWKKNSNYFWIANHNSNWSYIKDSAIYYDQNTIQAFETRFDQDFNDDGTIGSKSLPGIKIAGLENESIKSDVSSFLTDNLFSHYELKTILLNAGSNGITESEFNDLRLLSTSINDYLHNSTSSYFNYIYSSVVNGNKANQWWTNGSRTRISLGNLNTGSSETHMNRLVGKWFEGKDLPTNFVGGDSARGYGGVTFDYGTLTGDLFENGIDLNDLKQGRAGTCYLLAAVNCVLNDSESLINSMFSDNGDGTYGVRFYGSDSSEIWVTVNNQIPITSSKQILLAGNSEKSLKNEKWVSLLEKGYAQANEIGLFERHGNRNSHNSYWAIEGGWGQALSHINGKDLYGDISVKYTSNSNFSKWKSWEKTVINKLNNGNSIWLGSFGQTLGSNGKKDFVSRHAYSITAYDETTNLYTIYNPWGTSNLNSSFNHNFHASWSTLFEIDAFLSWT